MDVFELYEKDVRPTMVVEQQKDEDAMFDIDESKNQKEVEEIKQDNSFNISDEQKSALFEEFKKMMNIQTEEKKED